MIGDQDLAGSTDIFFSEFLKIAKYLLFGDLCSPSTCLVLQSCIAQN